MDNLHFSVILNVFLSRRDDDRVIKGVNYPAQQNS